MMNMTFPTMACLQECAVLGRCWLPVWPVALPPSPPLPSAHYSISRGNNQPAIYLGICLIPRQQSAQEYVLTLSHTEIYLSRGSNEHSTKDKNAFPCDCAFFNLSSLHKFSQQVILRQFWQSVHPCLLPTVNCLDPSKQHSHILQPMRVERISFWWNSKDSKKPWLLRPELLFPGPK